MEDYKAAFAATLTAALAYRRVTQGDLAARIGSSENAVWRWCNAVAEPRSAYLAAIADALDIPEAVFVRPAPDFDAAMHLIAAALGERRRNEAQR